MGREKKKYSPQTDQKALTANSTLVMDVNKAKVAKKIRTYLVARGLCQS